MNFEAVAVRPEADAAAATRGTAQDIVPQARLLLRQVPGAEERRARYRGTPRHGVHRALGLRQVDAAAHVEPDVFAVPGPAGDRRNHLQRPEHPRFRRRPQHAAGQGRDGVPEADAVPDVDPRQYRLRRQPVRGSFAARHGRARGMGADQGGDVGRGEGQAEAERDGAVRRAAAAVVHRARGRGQARGAAAGRADLRARSRSRRRRSRSSSPS